MLSAILFFCIYLLANKCSRTKPRLQYSNVDNIRRSSTVNSRCGRLVSVPRASQRFDSNWTLTNRIEPNFNRKSSRLQRSQRSQKSQKGGFRIASSLEADQRKYDEEEQEKV